MADNVYTGDSTWTSLVFSEACYMVEIRSLQTPHMVGQESGKQIKERN